MVLPFNQLVYRLCKIRMLAPKCFQRYFKSSALLIHSLYVFGLYCRSRVNDSLLFRSISAALLMLPKAC